jgi:CRP/FNR family transcriptional regulator, cyclic AMP receptor protein
MNTTYPIENVPLFTDLPPSQLEPLKESAVRLLYRPGEAIFQQGDLPQYLYIVEEGEVDIVLPAQGEELILASFQSGSFFGELAVFDNQPRSAAARACVDTSLIGVPLSAIASLLDEHPAAARRFLGVVIQRLRGADELMSRLHIKNVNDMVDQRMTFGERVADLVARFGGSWTFIIYFGAFLVLWTAVNSALILARPPDPYPYIFLNLILSCIAALQAPVIMMSQNRQAAKDRLQADQDFQINIKAEFAVQQLHRKLDELRAALMQRRHAAPGQQR